MVVFKLIHDNIKGGNEAGLEMFEEKIQAKEQNAGCLQHVITTPFQYNKIQV